MWAVWLRYGRSSLANYLMDSSVFSADPGFAWFSKILSFIREYILNSQHVNIMHSFWHLCMSSCLAERRKSPGRFVPRFPAFCLQTDRLNYSTSNQPGSFKCLCHKTPGTSSDPRKLGATNLCRAGHFIAPWEHFIAPWERFLPPWEHFIPPSQWFWGQFGPI